MLFAGEYGCSLDLPTVARIAKKYDVPVLVDSASQLPPRANLTKYLEQGATLACFKGGGAIRGPQSTGLVLGSSKAAIEACRLNNFPNRAIGRPMKVCKEEIVGLVAAVQAFMQEDEAAKIARQMLEMELVAASLQGIPGLGAKAFLKHPNAKTPLCMITLLAPDTPGGWEGPDAPAIFVQLRNQPLPGHPRVYLGGEIRTTKTSLTCVAQMLQPEEAHILAKVLPEAFRHHSRRSRLAAVSAADAAGITSDGVPVANWSRHRSHSTGLIDQKRARSTTFGRHQRRCAAMLRHLRSVSSAMTAVPAAPSQNRSPVTMTIPLDGGGDELGGARVWGHVQIPDPSIMAASQVPICVIRGSQPGRTALLLAGNHGNEYLLPSLSSHTSCRFCLKLTVISLIKML